MRRPPIPSVLGTFQITRELGQRSATLYVGQRDSDRAQVVIKLGDDETSFARIRHEAEVLGSLSHPHIVTFIDAGVFEGLPWYAMELVCGPSLAEVIARRWAERGEVMPPVALGALDEVLEQLCSLCSALSYLHGEGFVHADIKPANLIVGPDDTLTLIDFGLASRFGASGREILHLESDGITGTPAYMSPEQIRGEYVDARSDLYSLGCTVFEMLTGRPPFLGRLQAVLRAHLASEPPSIDSLVSGCPPPLVELVARLLSKQPQRRPSAAEALRRTASSLLPSERRARLRERGAAPAHSTTSPHLHRVDFVGREEEFDVLCREIERTTAGEGGVVLIEGESGVGKTRLVMETAIAAAEHGLRVIAGECRALAPGEDEQRIDAGSLEPLLPAFEALADLCIARPELRPSLVGARLSLLTPFVPRLAMLTQRGSAGGLPDDGPNRLRDAALEALAALASHRALMLVIDDLQWADALTLDVVGELADNGRIPGLLLVAAMRMSSRTRIVELAGRASVHIELGRLARPWVGELVLK